MNIAHFRQSLQKKGLYFCMREAWKMIWPIYWVRDVNLRDQVLENRAYYYLKRKYQPLLNNFSVHPPKQSTPAKIIWVCWLQGEQNAPDLVKKCIASMRQYAGDYEVRIITSENMSEYVTIPAFITHHLEKKHMQMCHLTDYLRTLLLVTYGGIWIDSTVLLTAPLPSYIQEAPLFCFKSSPLSISKIVASNWFIAAQPKNPILQQQLFLLERYWKRERHVCHYYFYHLLFSLVVTSSAENRKLWADAPNINNADVHMMQFSLFDNYTKEKWEQLCSHSSVHKLTYKFHNPQLIEQKGTIYRHIVD